MEDNNVAIRPYAIIEAKFDLEAKQNDIVDMLLTELKDDERVLYELNIDKYRKIYKTDTSNIYRDMRKAVEGFENKGVKIPINGKDTWFAWFTKITYMDSEGKIQLKVDPEFKAILTEVSRRINYDITNSLNCVSKYSKRLYYHLKLYEDTGWRIDILEELCHKLKCPASYFKSYGKFKEKVLNVAIREINNITDIDFDYEEIKENRKVVRLKFNINSKKIAQKLIEVKNDNHPDLSVEIVELLDGRIASSEMYKVEKILDECFNNKKRSKATDKWGYLKEKTEYVDGYNKNKGDESSYIALLLTALKEDWVKKIPIITGDNKKGKTTDNKGLSKGTKFNNFNPRDMYSDPKAMNDLEKKLLGWEDEEAEQTQLEVAVDKIED